MTVASSAPVSSQIRLAHQLVAFAALAAVEVEFECHRLAHRHGGGSDGRFGQDRAAEIGVQDGAGEIENGADVRRCLRLEPRDRLIRDVGYRRAAIAAFAARHAHGLDRGAQRRHGGLSAEAIDGGSQCRRLENVVNRWNIAKAHIFAHCRSGLPYAGKTHRYES